MSASSSRFGHADRSLPGHVGTVRWSAFSSSATFSSPRNSVWALVEMSAALIPASRISEERTAPLLISGDRTASLAISEERTASFRICGDPTLSLPSVAAAATVPPSATNSATCAMTLA